jgi:hypothetical protein
VVAGELGFDTGPYVNAAVFCEKAITEQDGVLSLIRVVDQINVQAQGPEAPDELPPGGLIQPTLVLVFKPGEARGSQRVRVDIEHPDTIIRKGPEQSFSFTGGPNNGVNIVALTQIALSTTGLYWANVYVNDRLVTRVPLQVSYSFTRPTSSGVL